MMKKNPLICLLATLAIAAFGSGCSGGEKHAEKRVVVLGVDGLDPEMLQERIDRGLMPNFKGLVASGTFQALQTSWPPQSPVAWSNFITGTNPGKHGLYDFIHVDKRNYGVKTSMTETDPVGLELSLFGYKLPLTGGEQRLTRAFPAFWETLDDAGIPVAVHRIPANFPPAPTDAVTFPDMGTPDLVGAASGKAHLWTESVDRSRKEGESYYILPVELNRNRPGQAKLEARIYGPPGMRDMEALDHDIQAARDAGDAAEARALEAEKRDVEVTYASFTAYVDQTGDSPMLAVDMGGAWVVAEEGGWTDWVPVNFDLLPPAVVVGGQTRFLFKSAEPFELYAAPVQIDPAAPITPVSTPDDASVKLAEAIGPYYTQGFPDAYKAYKADLLNTAEFVSQSDTVLDERVRMMDYALDEFDRTGGLLFFYYGSLDMRCHMLWHCQDREHPHQEEDGAQYAEEIDRIYMQIDDALGRLLGRLEEWPGTELMIISDHGFAPFRRKMHVNDWLLEKGYLVLKEGTELPAHTMAPGDPESPDWDACPIDWSRTKAYAIGFNGIYLNKTGREGQGIVGDSEAEALLSQMRDELLALRDNGNQVFTSIKTAAEVFSGPELGNAPDLQLGFNVGYGASDECAVGEITGDGVMVDNDSRWSGSHLMDPELVRGTLVINGTRQLSRDPRLEDVTATLFSLFDVSAPDGTDGVALY